MTIDPIELAARARAIIEEWRGGDLDEILAFGAGVDLAADDPLEQFAAAQAFVVRRLRVLEAGIRAASVLATRSPEPLE